MEDAGTPKSSLAIQHEQNQKLVQVKEEKIAAETTLEDVREDLEDKQEDVDNQVLYVNFLQSKIDELASVAEAGGADMAKVAEIRAVFIPVRDLIEPDSQVLSNLQEEGIPTLYYKFWY